jgi:hypothetical protein
MKNQIIARTLLALSLFALASLGLQRESPATKAAIEASLTTEFSPVIGPLTQTETWDMTARAIHNGVKIGSSTNDSAGAGEIGQHVRSYVASGVSVPNGTPVNITSISLTAGDWDVSAVGYIAGSLTGTYCVLAISVGVSATRGVAGDSDVFAPLMPTASSGVSFSIPAYRVSLASTTTIYEVGQCGYSAGTATAGGRLSARRVR